MFFEAQVEFYEILRRVDQPRLGWSKRLFFVYPPTSICVLIRAWPDVFSVLISCLPSESVTTLYRDNSFSYPAMISIFRLGIIMKTRTCIATVMYLPWECFQMRPSTTIREAEVR